MTEERIAGLQALHGQAVADVLRDAQRSNNGRLNSQVMTGAAKRAAQHAVKLGLMTMHHARFPGYGEVPQYQLIPEASEPKT